MDMNKLLKKLNKEQLKAVTHKSGPMLIIAGAGTGKTTVITHRVAWLIKQKLAKPSEILALTFTDKAATEMDERIMELLPYGVFDFTASTFHSFCQDVLKDYGIIGGISPDFKLLTQAQQILFLRQNLDKFDLNLYKPISNPNKFLGALIKLFSRAKDENISVDEYLNLATSYKLQATSSSENFEQREKFELIKEQAWAYQTYERLMNKHGYFDFGDLIIKTLWLLKNRPTILSELQNKYKYIFVDEFQDTNYTQAKIIYLLAKKYNNLCVVGDDDQSIYKFRGASISNIMEFLKYYPQAKKVVLTKNYRSTKQILNDAYKLIKYNNPNRLEIKAHVNKKLTSDKSGFQPEFWHFSDNFSEIEKITKYIIKKTTSHAPKATRQKYGDFAILVRANSYADDFITVFKKNNIPYQFVGSRGLYDKEEIRELISYFRTLFNPDDNLALFHLAWAPQYKIDKILLRRLTNLAKKRNISLFEIFENINNYTSEVSGDLTSEVEIVKSSETSRMNIGSLQKIIKLIKTHLKLVKSWPTSKILIDYIYKSGMYHQLKKIDDCQTLEKMENIRLFFQKISEFESISNDKDLFSFVEYLDLIIQAGDNPPVFEADKYENAVNIMTIHAAKGLEFDTVFLPYLIHGRFPSRSRRDLIELPDELIKEKLPSGDIHLQEERRLFYVACTRAQNELILSASDNYAGNKQKKKLSQFIYETISKKNYCDLRTQIKTNFLEQDTNQKRIKSAKKTERIKLSPSSLEAFNTCPKKFEYSYIFKIKTEQNQSLSFGNSIHNTLRDCYRLLKSDQHLSDEKISTIYAENWQNDGFESKKEMRRAYKLGLESIKKILKSDKQIPLAIEKKFKINIKNCVLNGRIDKILEFDDSIEIIDYKTGDSRKKTKSEISKNLPLWIYALAENLRFTPEVKSPETSGVSYISNKGLKITLHYVIGDKKITDTVTDKKLKDKKEKIIQICLDISLAINKNDFPAKPNKFNCSYCSYKSICPYKHKEA